MEKDSSSGGKVTGIIVTIVVVITLLGGAWYGFMYMPDQAAKEKARQEQISKERAREAQIAKEKQAEKKKANYNNLIEEADIAFEEENWGSAQSSYSQAISLFPNEPYPQDQLALVTENLAGTSTPGTIERITSATGRFYIVVSSSIDGDLAMDYANKMAAEGESVKMIEPYDNIRFYRVSLGDYAAWDKAVSVSTSLSSAYGEAIWVLKY